MDYITALGLPLDDVNNLSSIGTLAALANARKVLDSCPVLGRSSPKAALSPPISPACPGVDSPLVQTFCVGEQSKPSLTSVVPQIVSLQQSGLEPPHPSPVALDFSHSPSLVAAVGISAPPKSWSSVVTNSATVKNLGLSFFPPISSVGSVTVAPPVEVLKLGLNKWSTSLVGHFIHSKLPFRLVESSAKKLWGHQGLSKVYLHDKGYFIFKFDTVTDRDNVLASGPWYIASKLLCLQPWQEGVNFIKSDCSKVPIWVKLSNIPLSYWMKEGLSYLASAVGRPLFADDMTSKLETMSYARICIEMDALSTFPASINAVVFDGNAVVEETVAVKVEYWSRPPSCSVCKCFGHSLAKCPNSNMQWVPKASASASVVTIPKDAMAPSSLAPPEADGAWTTVSKGPKTSSLSSADPLLVVKANFFSPIASALAPGEESESPIPYNPLVDKVKQVDEIERKELKHKARLDKEPLQNSKKRNKGPRGSSPP